MKAARFWLCMAFLMVLAFAVMGSSCGGSSGGDVQIQNRTTTGRDSDVQAYVDTLKAVGGLNSDETLPDSAVSYNTDTSRRTSGTFTSTIRSRLLRHHPELLLTSSDRQQTA